MGVVCEDRTRVAIDRFDTFVPVMFRVYFPEVETKVHKKECVITACRNVRYCGLGVMAPGGLSLGSDILETQSEVSMGGFNE